MKSIFTRMFGNKHAGSDKEYPQRAKPEAGQVFSFRTRPYSEFAPSSTDRYAALKIVGADDDYVAVAVLNGIWPQAPTIKETRATSIINEHRFLHTGKPVVFGVQRGWWKPENELDEFRFVGMQAVSSKERGFAKAIVERAPGSSFSTLRAANYAAEGEWRWSNDREAFVSEVKQENAKLEAERAAKAERYRTRLAKLTWDQLLSETPFARWSSSPPFPPEAFTNAARTVILRACNTLKELGPKPRRADVRAILKTTVLWFNEADDKAGGVIETEEREDIYAILEEMAYLARQKVLVDEIDEWRSW